MTNNLVYRSSYVLRPCMYMFLFDYIQLSVGCSELKQKESLRNVMQVVKASSL